MSSPEAVGELPAAALALQGGAGEVTGCGGVARTWEASKGGVGGGRKRRSMRGGGEAVPRGGCGHPKGENSGGELAGVAVPGGGGSGRRGSKRKGARGIGWGRGRAGSVLAVHQWRRGAIPQRKKTGGGGAELQQVWRKKKV